MMAVPYIAWEIRTWTESHLYVDHASPSECGREHLHSHMSLLIDNLRQICNLLN